MPDIPKLPIGTSIRDRLEWLFKVKESKELQQIEAERCRRHPGAFLPYVWTFDPHDRKCPTKPFPCEPFQLAIADLIYDEPVVAIGKTRQMMISWLVCALLAWEQNFFDSQYAYIQSKKEQDADALLQRIDFIWKHVPVWLKQTNGIYQYRHMRFPEHNGHIQAVPQGAEQLRSHVATTIVSDEAAFQEKAEEAYGASKPTTEHGGKFWGLSTPGMSFYKKFFHGQLHDEQAPPGKCTEIMPGLRTFRRPNGLLAIELHWSAWQSRYTEDRMKTIAASMTTHAYAREYELNWDAVGGRPIYDMFDQQVHVLDRPPDIKPEWPKFRFMDHGISVHPTVCLWVAVSPENDLYVYREYTRVGGIIAIHAKEILRLSEGTPHFPEFVIDTYMDPSAVNKRLEDKPTTIGDEYREHGLYLIPANNALDDGIDRVSQRLLSALAREHILHRRPIHRWFSDKGIDSEHIENLVSRPALYISPRCVETIRHLRNWSWKENTKGEEMDKPDENFKDCCDALRYACNLNPDFKRHQPAMIRMMRKYTPPAQNRIQEDIEEADRRGQLLEAIQKRRRSAVMVSSF